MLLLLSGRCRERVPEQVSRVRVGGKAKANVRYRTANLHSSTALLQGGLRDADSVVVNMAAPGVEDSYADAQVGGRV